MANYSLVIDSTFQPFSLERYLQPSQIYDAAYREVEDTLSDYEAEAGQWEKLANEQTDPITHAQYKKYANDLRTQANQLAEYGLNPQSRSNMLKMKSRFASEIIPIVKAYERRRQLADEQRAKNVDGTWRFSKDFSKTSLDDMIEDMEQSYTQVSGREIMERAGTMFARLANVVNQEPDVQKRKDLKGYLQIYQKSGYDPEVALQKYGAEMPEELRNVYDTIDLSFADNPAYDKDWGHSWIGQAAYNAIGQGSYNIMDDKMVPSAYQAGQLALESRRTALAEEQFKFQKQQTIAAQLAAAGYNANGTYNIEHLAKNSLFVGNDGTPRGVFGLKAVFGSEMTDGRKDFGLTSGKSFDFSDKEDFTSQAFKYEDSELRQAAIKMVADYLDLSDVGKGSVAEKLAKKWATVYRDYDRFGHNEFMIVLPGIDPNTGTPMSNYWENPEYKQFIRDANERQIASLGELQNSDNRKNPQNK